MLKTLKIKNVALIAEAEITFGDGFNVMSGETGAGKSVILDSINFALGQKADKTMIQSGQQSCSVTCVFSVENNDVLSDVLSELDIDFDDEIIVKRTFSIDGKSSIKLNGEPVNAGMLRRVTSKLVDVHGQSDHFILLKESNQLALLDQLGGSSVADMLQSIRSVLAEIKRIDEQLSAIGGNDDERARNIDYLNYCIQEIERVDFKENEDEELLTLKRRLQNSEKIAVSINQTVEALTGDGGAVDMLTSAERSLSQVQRFDQTYVSIGERLSAIIDELGDLGATLNKSFEFDETDSSLDQIEARLDAISLLKSKYGSDYHAITEKYAQFVDRRDLLLNSAENAKRLLAERTEQIEKLNGLYKLLSDLRKKIAKKLSEDLVDQLGRLAMKNAKFDVQFETEECSLSPNGFDKVSFMFSANPGEPLKPLSKVISGGELSRLMLAIKTVTGEANTALTYIFDEVDAGISGVTAQTVAENFAKLSKSRQIIAISHLPQMVAMSDNAILIEKTESDGKAFTKVRELSDQEKIDEVLRLIGGFDSDYGRAHAKEMLDRAKFFKNSI